MKPTHQTYDLRHVPLMALRAEIRRRTGKPKAQRPGPKATCKCGKCDTCIKRKRMRAYRAKKHAEAMRMVVHP